MAWTSPMTATANTAFTAAQFNTHVRDNLLETAPAKATASGQYFVATGANAIAARTFGYSAVGTSESTTSTTYANLATTGPAVTITTGTSALCFISLQYQNSVADTTNRVSVDVSGATTIAADDSGEWMADGAPASQGLAFTKVKPYVAVLTAGSNTFTCKYRVSAGSGSFAERSLLVLPIN